MAVEEKIDFVKRSGLKLIEAEDGYVTCLMPAKGNQNHIGAMYAGALFTLAEIPGGALWLANFDITKCYPILKSFTIDYLKPALGDIQIRIGLSSEDIEAYQAQCMDNEKVEFELVGDLTDSQGQVVARSKGIYQLRRH
ncbi:thioesterase [Oleiphilus sp. HI0125]|nr:thioesterase [Oleiphilus sp. HI0125]